MRMPMEVHMMMMAEDIVTTLLLMVMTDGITTKIKTTIQADGISEKQIQDTREDKHKSQ